MALRLSEGLLSGLRNFGQQPMAQLNQSLAQPVNTSQALASSLGGMFGVDMRSPAAIQQAEQMAQQEQARQVYSEAMTADPQKQMELAGQLVKIQGYEKDALALAQQAQTKLEQQQARLQEQQQRETFANRARALGLNDTAELVLAGGDLKEAGNQIREEEKRRALIRGGKPARVALARRAGMSDQFIKELQEGKFDATDESEFAKILEGDQAELEVFLNTEGKAVPMRVDKYGKI